MANQKFNKLLSVRTDDVQKMISEKTDNGVSTINNGSRAIGTPFTVVSALSVHEGIVDANGTKGADWLGWDCSEKNARGNARVITPNGLGQFGSYPDEKWQGSTENAFRATAPTYKEQVDEMENFLKDCEGRVQVVAKAKHPRFEGQWIYAYGAAE